MIKEENYINRTLDRYDVKDKYTKIEIEKIRAKANEFVAEKSR